MCAGWRIPTCRAARRAGTRRSAAPGATGCRPRRCCSTAPATSRWPGTASPKARPATSRSASSGSRLEAMVAIAEAATCRRRILLRCFGDDLTGRLRPMRRLRRAATPVGRDGGGAEMISAVLRTGQRFGVAHVIDVLRGRLTDKVAQFGHDKLPTFGVGKDTGRPGLARRGAAAGGEWRAGCGGGEPWRAAADRGGAAHPEGRWCR